MKQASDFEAAYLAARYYVPEFRAIIQIGQRHLWLDQLLQQNGYDCWAFLTAENPRSKQLNKAQNQILTACLNADLKQTGCTVLKGVGQDPYAEWPDEYSFLVLGLSQSAAYKLAINYQQHAYLFGEHQQKAKLIWT